MTAGSVLDFLFRGTFGSGSGESREGILEVESNDVDEIYRRMALIRREPHAHVSDSVAGAEAVVDWGRFTWTYPWIALGAAGVAGLLIYNGSRRSTPSDAPNGAPAEAVEAAARPLEKGPHWSKLSLEFLLAAGGVLAPLAIRAGQNYLLHRLEQAYPTRTVNRTGGSPAAGERNGQSSRNVR